MMTYSNQLRMSEQKEIDVQNEVSRLSAQLVADREAADKWRADILQQLSQRDSKKDADKWREDILQQLSQCESSNNLQITELQALKGRLEDVTSTDAKELSGCMAQLEMNTTSILELQ